MKIVFIINSLGSGGSEMQLLTLASLLSEENVACEIFTLELRQTSPRIKHLLEECIAKGTKVFQPSTPGTPFTVRATNILTHLMAEKGVVVWTWGVRSDLVSKTAAIFNRQNTIIVSLRSACEEAIRSKAKLFRFASSRVHAYISNSELNIELFKEITGIQSGNFHVLHNVVTCNQRQVDKEFPTRENTAVSELLNVAVLGNNRFHLKGYDTLLEIARLSQSRGKSIRFNIAGRDYDQTMLEKIQEYGVTGTVKYAGEVADPIAFLAKNDAYLLTSRAEGMPNSLFEAASIGMPIVTTAVGDVRSLFPDTTLVRICNVGDASGLYSQLRDLQTHWDSAVEMGKNAQRRVLSEFGIDNARSRLREILARTVRH